MQTHYIVSLLSVFFIILSHTIGIQRHLVEYLVILKDWVLRYAVTENVDWSKNLPNSESSETFSCMKHIPNEGIKTTQTNL